MKQAYLEAVGGLSGDMMLGALVDAGLPLDALEETIEALGLSDEVRVSTRSLSKCGIAATKVDVEKIEHHHHHHAGDHHEHEHEDEDAHEHHHGRSAQELIEVIEAAGELDVEVRERSVAIIRRLAEAEAKIHDSTPEEVHFHELGGLDTIVDVVGAVEGLRRLGVEELHVSPLPIGHGWINCAHGRLPVPAPATAELLHDVPTSSVDIEGETVTPTGAALAAVLADDFGRPDGFISGAVGYGCGNADFDPVPNIVRLTLSAREEEARSDEARLVTVIEANIDDMTGELVPNAIDRALEAGALDCWSAPIVMKKGRPALLLRAICEPEHADAVADVLLRETTTLGVRMTQMHRRCLARKRMTVTTKFGEVAVKLGYQDDTIVTASPEYEDCRRAAEKHAVPLKAVYAAAIAAAHEELG
ncbi:MAG: nickel pincer cofactor biosynthesis protein LarC [Armatimonadota bacterium]